MWWDTIVLGVGVRALTMVVVQGPRDGFNEDAEETV